MFRIYIFFLFFIFFSFKNIYCSSDLHFLMRKSCHDNDYYKAVYFLYKIKYKSRHFFNLNCLLILCHFEKFNVVVSLSGSRRDFIEERFSYKHKKKKKYYNKARRVRTLAFFDAGFYMRHNIFNHSPIKKKFFNSKGFIKDLEKIDYDRYFKFSNTSKKEKIKEKPYNIKKVTPEIIFSLLQKCKEKEITNISSLIRKKKIKKCNNLKFIDYLIDFEKKFYTSSNLKISKSLKKVNLFRVLKKNNDNCVKIYKKKKPFLRHRNKKLKKVRNYVSNIELHDAFSERKILSCMSFLKAVACYKQSVFYYSFFNGNIYSYKYVLKAFKALNSIRAFPNECVSMDFVYIHVSKMLLALYIKKIMYYYANKAYYSILIETGKRNNIFLYANSFYFLKSLNEINLDTVVKFFLDNYSNKDKYTFLGFDKMYVNR